MSIKIYQSQEEIIEKLKSRGLNFDKNNLKDTLKKYNYFNLFNGIENIFLYSNNPKVYKDISLDDFLNIYKFDKKLSITILELIYSVEEKLKNSISNHVSAKYCSKLENTMQYTNKNNFMDPKESDPSSDTYCRYSRNYPFTHYQYKKYYNDFENFILFKPYYLTNLINQNDFIDKSFYTDKAYIAPSDVAVYRDFNGIIDLNVAVPIWIAILTLTFGQTIRFTHYLKDEVMEKVMADFDLELSKRNQFLNILDFILLLRNSCAHNRLISRFETNKNTYINSLLIRTFKLNPQNKSREKSSILLLSDVLKILSFFIDISTLKPIFEDIFNSNIENMGNKKGLEINNRLLKQIGSKNHEELLSILQNKKYTF
ncbi:Abi family protein [uncultured Anaerococcus sp.]|uniref:Abi family protein n=1 Tax=uncultured Anaerococcus sp. TaxID=293428 RepID=UPI002889FEF6|nr:Abi family protein [uncultured Anaerococcus sp.]